MKRKKDGARNRFQRRKDDAMLLAYARMKYWEAVQAKAIAAGVPVRLIEHQKGHQQAIREGYAATLAWFNGLDDMMRDLARRKLQKELTAKTGGKSEDGTGGLAPRTDGDPSGNRATGDQPGALSGGDGGDGLGDGDTEQQAAGDA